MAVGYARLVSVCVCFCGQKVKGQRGEETVSGVKGGGLLALPSFLFVEVVLSYAKDLVSDTVGELVFHSASPVCKD